MTIRLDSGSYSDWNAVVKSMKRAGAVYYNDMAPSSFFAWFVAFDGEFLLNLGIATAPPTFAADYPNAIHLTYPGGDTFTVG